MLDRDHAYQTGKRNEKRHPNACSCQKCTNARLDKLGLPHANETPLEAALRRKADKKRKRRKSVIRNLTQG